jgi:hypothetical protein
MPKPTAEILLEMENIYASDPKVTRERLNDATGAGIYQCRMWLKQRRVVGNAADAIEGKTPLMAAKELVDRQRARLDAKRDKTALMELAETREALDLVLAIKAQPLYVPNKIKSVHERGHKAAAVLMMSDWHVDAVVDPLTMNGLNRYDEPIAKDSVRQAFSNGMKLVEMSRREVDVDRVYVALLGDLLSGMIHDDNVESNSCSPCDAVLKLRNMVIDGLCHVLESFDRKVTVVCSVGNHGRTTEKIRHTTQVSNNYEYLLYSVVAAHFANNPRIDFVIEKGYHTYIDIMGYPVRAHHGHYMRYKGGIGGITIPLNKMIDRWNKSYRVYLDMLGHFHQKFDGGNFLVNGSVIGYDAYAISIGASPEPPQQVFFLMDNRKGKTVVAPIIIERKI